MTTPAVGNLQPVGRRRSVASEFRSVFRELRVKHDPALQDHRWPNPKWQSDPVGFAREILGIEPWSRQIEILEAVRDNQRVSITSGQKTGKSMSAAILALWFYCSFPDARVYFTSTTYSQVNEILWTELRRVKSRAKVPIDGELGNQARTGLKSKDFRSIIGFTSREAEAVQGKSGANQLYIVDEASGVPDEIIEAIHGNTAGGGRIVMISNPTRTSGAFFDSHHKNAHFYKTIKISSEETPNAVEGRIVVPGLATRDWIEMRRSEYGEDSAFYKVRVLGEFVLKEEGRVIDLHTIAEAQERWRDPSIEAKGRLFIGLDPSGEGEGGDETVFAVRRGQKILYLEAHKSLDPSGILLALLGILSKERDKREEAPIVNIDGEGAIGSRVWGHLRAYVDRNPSVFELRRIRASEWAQNGRPDRIYDRIRDELWASLSEWIKTGGAIPEDAKLASELHEPEWRHDHRNRLKVTPKDDLRKSLGRSPDRADAVALAVWQGSGVAHQKPIELPPDVAPAHAQPARQVINLSRDPYELRSNPYRSWR